MRVRACRDNSLHARNLREAAALHMQLTRALACAPADGPLAPLAAAVAAAGQALGDPHGSGVQGTLEPPGGLPSPLPPMVAHRLRRAIAAGWADQVGLLGVTLRVFY